MMINRASSEKSSIIDKPIHKKEKKKKAALGSFARSLCKTGLGDGL